MATALLSDTHKVITFLQKKSFSATQAEGFVEVVNNHIDLSHLATKEDIRSLREEMYRLKIDFYKALAAQTVVILGVMIAILQFLK